MDKMSVDQYVEGVRAFMEKHHQHVSACPMPVPAGVALLRARLIAEEAGETIAAIHEENLVEIADGLADLLYVTFGTAIAYGIPIAAVFAEVQRSNMTKPRLNKHAKGGKVKKGKRSGFQPPRIARLLS